MSGPASFLDRYAKLDQLLFAALPSGYARAAYAKANFLLFRKLKLIWPVEVETRHRLRMIADKVDRVGGYIYYFHIWEPQISTVIVRLLDPGDTVLDIGAHIGHHTLLAAQAVGESGQVYAFEASPQTFAVLNTNIGLNHFANVDARNLAICARTGSIDLFVSPHENSGRSSLTATNGRRSIEVHCTRLDDLLSEIPCLNIRFIKIDVEGAEPEVLAGARELLGRLPADVAILIEVQPGTADDSMDGRGILQFLLQQGFEAYSINNGYSAAKYDAPAKLTALADLRLRSTTDVFFLRGRFTDRVSDLIVRA
ncbi:MAG TPA: FkbM family methyltransferase [Rhodopila sp.]